MAQMARIEGKEIRAIREIRGEKRFVSEERRRGDWNHG